MILPGGKDFYARLDIRPDFTPLENVASGTFSALVRLVMEAGIDRSQAERTSFFFGRFFRSQVKELFAELPRS